MGAAATAVALCLGAAPGPIAHPSGAPVRVTMPLHEDAELQLIDDTGVVRLRAWTADGSPRTRLGWVPDSAPEAGRLQLELAALHLPTGSWTMRLGTCERTLSVEGGEASGRLVDGSTSALIGRRGQGSQVSLAWIPPGGTVPAGGGWDLTTTGTETPRISRTAGGTGAVSLEPVRPDPRPRAARHDDLVRIGLLPVTGLVLVSALLGSAQALRRRGWPWLVVAGVLAALTVTGSALFAPQPTLLSTGGPVSDPTDSVAQLAALVDALPALSSGTQAFSAPEGADWLTVGPSWLAYLPVVPLAAWLGPVRAQTLGLALGAAMLAVTTAGLAWRRGARPLLAAAAGLLAALAPAIVDEWDAMSLDRSALWAAPLVALALDRAAEGARWGRTSAAVAMATALLGQIYYGLLLVLAAPVLAVLRCLGPRAELRPRLTRLLGAGALAGVLATPVLVTLQAGTSGTGYDATAPLPERITAVTSPLSADEASAMARSGRRGKGYRNFDLTTARSRVLAAGSMSLTAEEVLAPRPWLPGGAWAWPLLALAVVLAPDRRKAGLATAEVVVFMGLALGPFLQVGGQPGAGVTPWGALAIALPGFDQLKNIDRAALLAASLAPAVLALGAEGLVRRVESRQGARAGFAVALALCAGLVLGLGGLRWERGGLSRAGVSIRTQVWRPDPGLAALPPGTVISLPLDGPVAAAQSVPVLEAGLGLVNAPPFEVPLDAAGPWADDLPLLNRLATLSGDVHGTRPLPPGDPASDLRTLAEAGVVGVVLHPDRMPGPNTAAAAAALLDGLLQRTGDQGGTVVWAVPPAGGG